MPKEEMKPYYETPDGRAKLYLGDSRWMPEIETESIDMIATSPPYWGKRDYGKEVIAIWGGKDGCEHEWNSQDRTLHAGRGDAQKSGKYSQQEPIPDAEFQDAHCSLCGAWRGQLGLEPTWGEYIQHLCECAQEWWRVLKPTGNLFVNMGDTFGGQRWSNTPSYTGISKPCSDIIAPRVGTIPKMKLGIPYRFRFALNDMGWVSRADIIWYKGKDYGDVEYIARSGELIEGDGDISKVAMPESSRREACSYEMVFRFAKTSKMNYYVHERTGECRSRKPSPQMEGVDFEWVEHAACEGKGCDKKICHDGLIKSTFWHGYSEWFDLDAVRRPLATGDWVAYPPIGGKKFKEGVGGIYSGKTPPSNPAGANPGDVWIIQPEPFPRKHYAVWPSELCERMIKVGCPKEVCPVCGKPRERIRVIPYDEDHPTYNEWRAKHASGKYEGRKIDHLPGHDGQGYGGTVARYYREVWGTDCSPAQTIGWSDCGCGGGFVPGVVLDPFGGGSGRLQERALFLGRNAIMVDMKREYLEMAKKPLLQGVLL